MNDLTVLAEEVGVSDRTLRRALNQGTLHAARQSPRRLRLPLAERQYIRRSWPLLAAMRRVLRTESNVRFALLFGSAARGDDSSESDVDILVDLRDSRLERVLDVSSKMAAAVSRPVDVLRLEDAERDPSFLADALSEGRVLVDRDRRWPGLHRRQRALRERGQLYDRRRARVALAGLDRLTP